MIVSTVANGEKLARGEMAAICGHPGYTVQESRACTGSARTDQQLWAHLLHTLAPACCSCLATQAAGTAPSAIKDQGKDRLPLLCSRWHQAQEQQQHVPCTERAPREAYLRAEPLMRSMPARREQRHHGFHWTHVHWAPFPQRQWHQLCASTFTEKTRSRPCASQPGPDGADLSRHVPARTNMVALDLILP